MTCQLGNVVKIIIFTLVLFLVSPLSVCAKEAIPVAEDPEIEKRMLALTVDLRCLVCQNESIADSRAEFSNDIRREIREQIKANKTDKEIVQFLVDRYGDFVLYNPPMKPTTILLWFGPVILFMIGLGSLVVYLRRRRLQIEDVALSPEQLNEAEALLNENKKGKGV
ncbi:cytochrome c-type biogenesis protein CcmH [Nitrosomonas ureae]|uniref:Cytochrome c-type biogenesis protein n=1 Tax=Nitrosomonas ureae TaxID=44577 RepID=A0A285BUK1_9PROT|nr:cytochrome c-type biogenesis protein [Nitrosomonas ureae]SNX58889.1 cytochrome c-type biogenesis protein CcmH [Nitrosomonas ureae]